MRQAENYKSIEALKSYCVLIIHSYVYHTHVRGRFKVMAYANSINQFGAYNIHFQIF